MKSHTLTVGCVYWCAWKETSEHHQTIPSDCLLCSGQAVSRIEYAELFEKIGIQHGAGDGSTTFNIPNLNNRFIEGGWSSPSYPNSTGKFIEAGLPNIAGYFNCNKNVGLFNMSSNAMDGCFAAGATSTWFPQRQKDTDGRNYMGLNFNASFSNPIYGKSNTVQPNAIYLVPLIVAKSNNINSIVAYCFHRLS